ncbi:MULTISPECIES: hypothetical protein [unclassified Sphingomonas]|uniref:hypothetical protein n=1 Tax=unclassified Sphingomonas TaxID=196159 RepID=UPI002269DE03|nr:MULTISPECIES: hypothetical protein [unclassified Sphingomonas]
MRYRRVSDGQTVPAGEACDAAGTVRNGYALDAGLGQSFVKPGDYIGFDMALCDSALRPPVSSSSLPDNQQAAIVAHARMTHRTSNAYLGDRAPAFTDAMAAAAVQKVEGETARLRTNDAMYAADAVTARANAEAARARMTESLNSWRK